MEAKEIYKGLTEDPVRTHIASSSEATVYAVADVLRQFFRRLKHYLGWKFPGGASDPGENIFETATLEVFEETGVKAVAKAVLCFSASVILQQGETVAKTKNWKSGFAVAVQGKPTTSQHA
ncbi:unnamed protein product [Heligmosomoides polygyrus]|uniref:Nudix hydrolase domain-containing protein n=1 Tax=Heligmosomoides polygyrus TaxID=6339 RepID=A0A3P8AL32_HELPZ|nr:unnamed protein product [Heligmosomoides polygyrus]